MCVVWDFDQWFVLLALWFPENIHCLSIYIYIFQLCRGNSFHFEIFTDLSFPPTFCHQKLRIEMNFLWKIQDFHRFVARIPPRRTESAKYCVTWHRNSLESWCRISRPTMIFGAWVRRWLTTCGTTRAKPSTPTKTCTNASADSWTRSAKCTTNST